MIVSSLRPLALAALVALVACDAGPAEPTAPAVRVTATTETSVTLAWDGDAEATYEVRGVPSEAGGGRPPAVVRGTSITLNRLLGIEPFTVSVRAVAADGPSPAAEVRFQRDGDRSLAVSEAGRVTLSGDRLYVEPTGQSVRAFALDVPGEAASDLGSVPGYPDVVSPLSTGEVLVEAPVVTSRERGVAVADGAQVVAASRLVSPGGPFEGAAASGGDGSLIALAYAVDGGVRIGAWDPRTGALLDDGAGAPPLVPPLGLRLASADGIVVLIDRQGDVVGRRIADGAELWRRVGRGGRAAVDGARGQVAVQMASPGTAIEVLGVDGQRLTTITEVGLQDVPDFLDGGYVGVRDGDRVTVVRLADGAPIRDLTGVSPFATGGASATALHLHQNQSVRRVPLDAVWMEVTGAP